MNDFHFRFAAFYRILDADDQAPPPHDELDSLLRAWHHEHANVARADRERILATVWSDRPTDIDERPIIARIGHALTGRIARIAACIAIVATIATVLVTPSRNEASAATTINVAEGGELTALGADGDRLGPCPLQHTDVDAEVTGPFTRVTLRQRYANPYPQKIEAVYTFPMSHRAAVDHMRIIVKGPTGERIVDGEVKEREAARQIYESAKASGYVASLLEQERPNIFTQSVANIEPGSSIIVEIGYLETLQRKDGVYSFNFPMTVGPRYVPGAVRTGGAQLPDGLVPRAGLVLLGPGQVEVIGNPTSMTPQAVQQILAVGKPIRMPSADWFERNPGATGSPTEFVVTYANGAKETGQIYPGGSGHVNGRWFWYGSQSAAGAGFAGNTDQVPDASRVTPMPVKPTERAGHDVSVRVTIDSGGAPLRDVSSELHEISMNAENDGGASKGERTVITLKQKNAIPNRDFVLSWKSDADLIAPGVYAHMRQADDATKGGYFAMILDPPARVEDKDVPARELIFVLDTSGSMNGFPIEKAKEVMSRAITSMRPQDTFNVITFAGSTNILWPQARSANDDNKLTAQRFVNERQGGGGTEMMTAINAALKPLDRAGWLKPKELADLPADGRAVRVSAPMTALNDGATALDIGDGKSVRVLSSIALPTVPDRATKTLSLEGHWITKDGDRVFTVDRASFERTSIAPTRIVMFLTDGLVANEGAIMQAVRDNAKTTRVFSFGIGQSVNRSLLDGIAREGRGASEFVTLAADADAAVARFVRRIQSPVLVDIEASFVGVEVTDVIPDPTKIPDLFDEEPLIIVGRYAKPGAGALTLHGMTGGGRWERTIDIALPEHGSERAAVPTLWARAKVESVVAPNRAAIEQQKADAATHTAIVALGEAYQIMTPFTSFVAVERGRVTVGGSPMLVQVPIELPEGTSWNGFFGENVTPAHWFADLPVRPLGAEPNLGLAQLRVDAIKNIAKLAAASPDAPSEQLGYFLGGLSLGVTVDGDGANAALAWDERKMERTESEELLRSAGHQIGGGGLAGSGSGGATLPARRSVDPSAQPAPSAVAPASARFRGGETLQPSPVAPSTSAPSLAPSVAPSVAPASPPASAPQDPPALHTRGIVGKPTEPPGGAAKSDSADGARFGVPGKRALKEQIPPPGPAGGFGADTPTAKSLQKDSAPPPPDSPAKPGAASGADRSERVPVSAPASAPASDGRMKEVESEKTLAKPTATEPASSTGEAPKDVRPADLADANDRFGAPATEAGSRDDHHVDETLKQNVASKAKQAKRVLSPTDRDTLARRLERTLLALALAAEIDPKPALDLAKTAQPSLSLDDNGMVRVTALIAADDADATARLMKLLRDSGVVIDASDTPMHILVLRVRLDSLIDLALREGIRRVEPFRAKPAVTATNTASAPAS